MNCLEKLDSVRGLRVVLARIGILSNNPSILHMPAYLDPEVQDANPRIWSFLTSLYGAEDIPFGPGMDGYIYVFDSKEAIPDIFAAPDRVVLSGDISGYEEQLEANPSAKRWTLFGNGGILSKFSYTLLERCYGMLSFHATSMYDEARNEMYVIVGSPGAGKTVMMLEGSLRRGYRIFATEMTHVHFTDRGATFYKGSLYDNIRVATLVSDYPEARDVLKIENMNPENTGEAKIGVNFAPVQTRDDVIVNPRMNWLLPRIEAESTKAIFTKIEDRATLVRMLYENASEMIVRPRIYYGRLALSLIDYPRSAAHRLELCQKLVDGTATSQAKRIFAGAKNCMVGVK
jgi:hypothetical protein